MSNQGNFYISILFFITIQAPFMLFTYKIKLQLFVCFVNTGTKYQHTLDNECLQELKEDFFKQDIDFKLVHQPSIVPMYQNTSSANFINNFISILSTVDSHCPMAEWDRLIPPKVLTINLLCSSCIHPSQSAYACLFGNHDQFDCVLPHNKYSCRLPHKTTTEGHIQKNVEQHSKLPDTKKSMTCTRLRR